VKTRGEELVAIQETIKILNDDDALELFKKTLPGAGASNLLQVNSNAAKEVKTALRIVQKLRSSTTTIAPNLDLLAMALSGRGVGFTKVLKMIDDMVALLKSESLDDEHKKEYCDAQLDMAEDKAKELQGKLDDLTISIEEKEALIKVTTEDIKVLTKSIKNLDKSVSDATYQRKGEHDEYVELMSSNNAAKELLAFAKNRLNKFYNPKLYKAPPKAESEASFVQATTAFVQINAHTNKDAPPAPPPTPEGEYKKSGEASTGVIGMIDLLVRDLDKEMTEAEGEEKNSQGDYEGMMNDSATKRAADTKAIAAKESAKADAEEGHVADEASKMAEFKELSATKQYEGQLHSECDWLIQNFDLRKTMRGEEMDNLKQAKAVLSGADFSLLQSKTQANLRGA